MTPVVMRFAAAQAVLGGPRPGASARSVSVLASSVAAAKLHVVTGGTG
jgi:hypothetical protein